MQSKKDLHVVVELFDSADTIHKIAGRVFGEERAKLDNFAGEIEACAWRILANVEVLPQLQKYRKRP